MRKVQWSQAALADIEAHLVHIAKDNPAAARMVALRLSETGDALASFATGHPGRISGTYEKSVRGLPYIVAYALTGGDTMVSILRVIHTARDWRKDRWPGA